MMRIALDKTWPDKTWPEVAVALREDAGFGQASAGKRPLFRLSCYRHPVTSVSEPRELRGLVLLEVAAVLALAIVPLPDAVPVAAPLFAVASASRWMRGRTWSAVLGDGGFSAGAGLAAGLAALVIALVAGGPFVEMMSGRAVEWSGSPVVGGSATQLLLVALIEVALAIAWELSLRGWIVERLRELSPGPPVLPVVVGAIAEALLTPGDLAVRIGAGLFGAGLGWMYVAGRGAIAPICARIGFGLGAVLLEAVRLIG
jgi:hypothetical protein